MAGNKNSGRLPKQDERRQAIHRYYKSAVAVLGELMENAETPAHVRADCAQYLIDQAIGKAKQTTEVSGELKTVGTFVFQMPDGTIKTASELGKSLQ